MSKSIAPWPVSDVLAVGRRVLVEEASALSLASDLLNEAFVAVVEAILGCKGRIVVSGVGKSGHVGRKIAATLASTGTPAFFVHAAEAGHGDLGMITNDDLLFAISNSGESDEVVNIASFSKRFNVKIIALTSKPESSLAKLADLRLITKVETEACPLGVAPTTSPTLQLAMGDAVAMATLAKRGFSTQDFARTHPLGQLGRHYYLKVGDVMQGVRDIPHAQPEVKLKDALPTMAMGRVGAIVVLKGKSLAGIFTDSDLRRLITDGPEDFGELLERPIGDFVTAKPMTIAFDQLASEALRLFEAKRISRLVCVDGSTVVGLLGWHNLLEHKVA
jgi:arabinose-5-phosphate isomerase